MKSRKLLVKSLILAVCTALIFVSGTSVVAASVSSTGSTSSALSTTTAPVSGNCVGWSAFSNVGFKVNGVPVSSLYKNVVAGSTVTATFKLKSSCDGTPVGIASYNAVSNHGNTQSFGLQTLSAKDDGVFPAGVSSTVSVVVPNCYFQVDFYTGTAATPGDLYTTSGRLVGTDVGGTTSCASGSGVTTTTVRPTTTTTAPSTTSTTAPVFTTTTEDTTSTTAPLSTTTTAPSVGGEELTTTTTSPSVGATSCTPASSKVTNYSVTVGSNTYQKLSSVTSGDTVTVHFTVGTNCTEVLSLASYKATTLNTTQAGVLSQTLYSSDTGTFGPGDHTLTVTIPSCMYQVDFVTGGVINNFGPVGSTNYYGSRILDTAVGGTVSCTDVSPSSTTTTTSPSVGGEQVTTTTTRPTDVQAEAVTTTTSTTAAPATTTTVPAVDATNVSPALATTGFDMVPVLCLGIMLLGIGGFLLTSGRRLAMAAVESTPRHRRR